MHHSNTWLGINASIYILFDSKISKLYFIAKKTLFALGSSFLILSPGLCFKSNGSTILYR